MSKLCPPQRSDQCYSAVHLGWAINHFFLPTETSLRFQRRDVLKHKYEWDDVKSLNLRHEISNVSKGTHRYNGKNWGLAGFYTSVPTYPCQRVGLERDVLHRHPMYFITILTRQPIIGLLFPTLTIFRVCGLWSPSPGYASMYVCAVLWFDSR